MPSLCVIFRLLFVSPVNVTPRFPPGSFWVVPTSPGSLQQEPLNYIPAWGGFCSWGISREDWWTAETLGPDTDPNYWVITDDGVLHFFRRWAAPEASHALSLLLLSLLLWPPGGNRNSDSRAEAPPLTPQKK